MACMICLMSSAQKKLLVYGVGFYNQENLFDTIHDEGKRDFEFLPNGSYRWDGLKYSHKLKNMSKALADMGTDMLPNVGCAIIGVSEVENARVLTDLCAQEPLKARNMQFCHIEGPDKRGVDCALLYNPALFKVNDVKLHPYVTEQEKDKDSLPVASSPSRANLPTSRWWLSWPTCPAASLPLTIVNSEPARCASSRTRCSARIPPTSSLSWAI